MESSSQQSVVVTPKQKGGSSKVIWAVIGVLVLAGGIIAGVILVGRQQELREKAQTAATPCSSDTCTNCILTERPDILPFYQQNGWDISCGNQINVVNNWCSSSVDPGGCRVVKEGVCATACGVSSGASAATATPTPNLSPTPTPTPRPTSTPRPSATPRPSRTPTPTATSRVSIPSTPVPVPDSGVGLPTIVGASTGLILIVAALLLAL